MLGRANRMATQGRRFNSLPIARPIAPALRGHGTRIAVAPNGLAYWQYPDYARVMDFPEEPPRKRCKRYDVPGDAHYLTFSCFQRRPFFSRQRTRDWFLVALDAARSTQSFDIWAFVVMPEHVHLLIFPRPRATIRAILTAVKLPVARRAVAWVRRYKPAFLQAMADVEPTGKACYRFWQRGGGYDRNLWSIPDIHQKIDYIHANPVRRGLVQRPQDWPWSSFRAWEDSVDEPIRIDRGSLPPLDL
ncbi:MAG: REP-associated tyrosine transposase [Pirellulales bacterium]